MRQPDRAAASRVNADPRRARILMGAMPRPVRVPELSSRAPLIPYSGPDAVHLSYRRPTRVFRAGGHSGHKIDSAHVPEVYYRRPSF